MSNDTFNRGGMRSRALQSIRTFDEAKSMAESNGMTLTNPSDGCYQLKELQHGWIWNLYPRTKGFSPRCYTDPHHRCPKFLDLPENWTLLDAVQAAVTAVKEIK